MPGWFSKYTVHKQIIVRSVCSCMKVKLTWTNQIPTQALSEVVEHSISVLLVHLGVDVETWIAKFCNLFRQKLHSLSRVAEYDRLIDL